MTGRKRPEGLVIGSLIAISFGTVFVMVNSGGPAAPWPLVIRVVAAVIAVGLVVALFRTVRTAPSASAADGSHEATQPAAAGDGSRRTNQPTPAVGGFADRRYWVIVALEAVALFGGLAVINQVVKAPDVSVAWIAVVVGTHFFALAWAWRMPMYHWLGAVMTALGLGGFLAYAAGADAATVALIAGVGSGFALFGSVVAGLRHARRVPAAA